MDGKRVKVSFRLFNRRLLFVFRAFRTRTALGIKSTIGNTSKHFLLYDFDDENSFQLAKDYWKLSPMIWYKTPHGIHLIVFERYSLEEAAHKLLMFNADKDYVACGLRRGYWFLETHGDKMHSNILLSNLDTLNFQKIERHA